MGYRVTDTIEVVRMNQGGSEVKVNRVYLVTDQGASGYVDVPLDKWNKDDLPGILQEKTDSLNLAFAIAG